MTDVSTVIVDETMPPPPTTDEPESSTDENAPAMPYGTDQTFPIPELGQAFAGGQDLRNVAERLLARDEQIISDLNWNLKGTSIRYEWKQKGGTSRGKPLLANITRLGGLARYYGRSEFTVWVAADHAREMKPSYRDMEAILFHELMKVDKRVSEDDEITYQVRNPTIMAFPEEVELFGLWREELEEARATFEQLGLGM